MPGELRSSFSGVEGRSSLCQGGRRGSPTTMRATLRKRAYSMMAVAGVLLWAWWKSTH